MDMKHRGASLAAVMSTFLVVIAACGQGQPQTEATPTARPAGAAANQLSLEERESLYQVNCLVCHGDRRGEGGNGLGPPHNEQGHTWHHPDAQLEEWILNGRLFGGMPAFKDKLAGQDVEAILAYIKPWWTEEQRQSQADISKRYQEALDKQKKGQ